MHTWGGQCACGQAAHAEVVVAALRCRARASEQFGTCGSGAWEARYVVVNNIEEEGGAGEREREREAQVGGSRLLPC